MCRMALSMLIRGGVALLLVAPALSADSWIPADAPREAVIKLAAKVQRADYEGDRPALKRLYEELTPFTDAPALSARVRYWRGFALWRRVINGFNETAVDLQDVERDLQQALDDFEKAFTKDPAFVDAKVGAVACLGLQAYLNRNATARMQEFASRTLALLKEAESAAPENPRLLWVRGPIDWNLGPNRDAREAVALATYEKGLELARRQKVTDPLEPSWGEPELLMSLAWLNLNRTPPDIKAAEGYASEALKLVPYWHYVRDILIPQIQKAKGPEPFFFPESPSRHVASNDGGSGDRIRRTCRKCL